MSRRKKKEPVVDAIAYLSATGPLWEIEKREQKQERYLKDYAKAHNLDIVGVVHRNGLGQSYVNRQFDNITNLIRQKRVEAVLIVNMMSISKDIPDAYYKIGKILDAGGVIITVDEGKLGMSIKESEVAR